MNIAFLEAFGIKYTKIPGSKNHDTDLSGLLLDKFACNVVTKA